MDISLQHVITEWHTSVNSGDTQRSAAAVGDPLVVLGPRGVGSITPHEFAQWVRRSGIQLIPHAWHQVSEKLVVVEQDATWPGSHEPTSVATIFRVNEGQVTAALRLSDVKQALKLAQICREMAATE